MSQDLAQRLREGTKQSHTAAENTAFMKCFLKGIVEREPFRKFLSTRRSVRTHGCAPLPKNLWLLNP